MRYAWSGEGRAPAHRPLTLAPEPGADLAARIVGRSIEPIVVVATRQDAGAPPTIVHASPAVARLLGRDRRGARRAVGRARSPRPSPSRSSSPG